MLLLFTLCLAAPPGAEYPALKQRLQRGNYAEARAGYEELLKTEKPLAAYRGLAACERAEGRYQEALDTLAGGLKAFPDEPSLLAARADLFLYLGKWDEAERDASAAIKKDEANFLARWVKVRLLRDRGDIPAADREVRWFVKTYSDASAAGKEITNPEHLLLIGLAGAENARWNNKPQQFAFILNEVYRDALKADPDCWQAENQAGRLLFEKHNRADAAEAFDKALKINPKAVEALVGKGMLCLDELDSQGAGRFADQALKVDPKHPEALRLKADARLAEGDAQGAERLLLAARLTNPCDEATEARLAVLAHLARKPDGVRAITREVEKFCPKPGRYFAEMAEVLSSRKQYARAEDCYKSAMELRPDLARARAGLGLLYMQLGREPEARAELEAAFKADPFNVRVSNALKVLDHLTGYATRETAHFVIKYDPRTDRVLAAFLGDYLEKVHDEFAKLYAYTPPGKLLVEVMATREMFSGRVLSLPGLPGAAQGASTGPLIAVPSPRADGAHRPFNWAVVARHELTHAFNLGQTEFLVPIWLTEGLAVRAEQTRRFDNQAKLLRERLAEGATFDLDTIGRGYHNFANPSDVMLAYLQGYHYVEYIVLTHGDEAIPRLLDSFRMGLDASDAIRRACGVEKTAFEKGYRDYLQGMARGTQRPEKPMSFSNLEAAHAKNPSDPDIAARLAGEYLRRGKTAEAKKLSGAAIAAEKGHPAASIVLARILQRDKDIPGARATLEAAVRENQEDPRLLLALARLYMDAGEPEKAAAELETLRKLGMPDTEILVMLEKLYTSSGKTEALMGVLAELSARAPDDIEVKLKLARLHHDAGNLTSTERFAREALHVNVLDEEARKLLLAALRGQKKSTEADRLEELFRPEKNEPRP
jgi:tetratricopeptide (TPR) repeat protein